MEGSTPAVIRMTRGTCSTLLRFVRDADGLIRVSVPLRKHNAVNPFDIMAATDVPTFTAARDVECDCVRFTIRTRSELRSVIAVATNHLNWLNDDEIKYCFTES